MSKKSSLIARRTWNLLRLALLWTRKGELFRDRLIICLNIFHKVVRKLINSNESRRALVYGDREFSFEDTPIIHVKMHRPSSSLRFWISHIPCMKPQVDFDYDEEENVISEDGIWSDEYDDVQSTCTLKEEDEDEEEETNADYDEGIDLKAEKFIATFYEQMKLQRQMSYPQNDMIRNNYG